MSDPRIVIAQFCDDVRQEVGNKYSLMGCYGDELIVDKLPAVLPKLCAQIRAITPVEYPFSTLILRAFLNDDCIAEIDVPLSGMFDRSPKPEAHRQVVMAIMAFAPLAITEPCRLRIEAETEDGTLRGGSLLIREHTPDDPKL